MRYLTHTEFKRKNNKNKKRETNTGTRFDDKRDHLFPNCRILALFYPIWLINFFFPRAQPDLAGKHKGKNRKRTKIT